MSKTAKSSKELTPAMRQYKHFKEKYPDAVLFFRMGDFYEMFYDDAIIASQVLGLALTSRSKGDNAVPLAGVPYHAMESYLNRLIKAGYRVAICEQVEDAKLAQGVVKRDVVRLVTAGTLTDEALLSEREENFLAAVCGGLDGLGLAWVEVSTGAFNVMSVEQDQLLNELVRLRPAECLFEESWRSKNHAITQELRELTGAVITERGDWAFADFHAEGVLQKLFGTTSLAGFGFEQVGPEVRAAGAIIDYLNETQKTNLGHISKLSKFERTKHVQIDQNTLRALEVERTLRDGKLEGSLLACLQETYTPMGSRMLRRWLCFPLADMDMILDRQEAVAVLVNDSEALRQMRGLLKKMTADLERTTARVSCGRCSPRDLLGLGSSLRMVPTLKEQMGTCGGVFWERLINRCDELVDVTELIEKGIDPNAPNVLRDGGVIKDGYDAQLDRLRGLSRNQKEWLADFQQEQVQTTGIPSLRVGYNQVFGFYIEVTNTHRDRVPEHYIRKQTLKNAERYITEKLKEYETQVLEADEKSKALEAKLFEDIRRQVAGQVQRLQQTAEVVAQVDTLACLGQLAVSRNYCRPGIDNGTGLEIIDGKHPVLAISLAERFVPNDVTLNERDRRIAIITGPNMSGKSTYIRQTALLVIMAQIGSFIPASRAGIGVVDRIYTRVGATDELARGQSTFMVEMTETANILNNATDRSLVILDEVGRGTSTYDGLALAWAVTEHISSQLRCRTLFATHYHELTDLADLLDNVINLNVLVREWADEIVFLHRIVPGGTDKSYGIHVARLAGIPRPVIHRARKLLERLEASAPDGSPSSHANLQSIKGPKAKPTAGQLTLFSEPPDRLAQTIKSLDLDQLSPLDALTTLKELQEKAKEG
ncbi:MAG: DNA mismatch repair protein MutS [Actinobacteria bacterium]|nr:DNA mismatch repair protein MutS [Actinomycetota bacterium]